MTCWDWFNICNLLKIPRPEEPSSASADNSSACTSSSIDSSRVSSKSSKKQVSFQSPENQKDVRISYENKMSSPTQEYHPLSFPAPDQSPQPGPSRLMYRQSLPLTKQPKTEDLNQLLLRMRRNAESKLLHYNLFMEEILKTDKVLTNTQFKKLHEKHKSHLIICFSNDYQNYPTLTNTVNNFCLKLISDIDFQYRIFLKKYQLKMKKIGLKQLQFDAESFYESDMENFRPREKSRAQVKGKHVDAVKGALEYFDHLASLDQGLMVNDQDRGIFRNSLKNSLDTKLQEILKGCLTFNVGIYLGDQQVVVGTMDIDNSQQIEVLAQVPAGIIFTQKNIKFTEPSRHYNYFSVRGLIKNGHSNFTVQLQTKKFTLLPEEILAIYFEKLFSPLQSIDNVVITVPFNCTSSEKRRIKEAARLASMPQVKILSSVVATAVAFAAQSDYYSPHQLEPKLVFVSHCLQLSFSMALIDISTECIATAICTGSENIKECQNIHFPTTHAQMFANQDSDQDMRNLISRIYASAAQYTLNGRTGSGGCSSYVVIKDSDDENKLNEILSEVLNVSVQNKGISEGPLAGACFLASKMLPSSLLPEDLQVYDASASNLIVSVNSMKRRIELRNRVHIPELPTFQFTVAVPPEGTKVVIHEEFSKSSEFLVGRWNLMAKMPGSAAASLITLRGLVDQDGIFSIDAAFPGGVEVGKVHRLENKKECCSDIKGLRLHYEASTAQLKTQGRSTSSITSTVETETNTSRSMESIPLNSETQEYEHESLDSNDSEETTENTTSE